MLLTCHPVVVRSQNLGVLLPWPHVCGAYPSDEDRADFVAPGDATHPYHPGHFLRSIRLDDPDPRTVGTVMAAICLYNDTVFEEQDDDAVPPEHPTMLPLAQILGRLCEQEEIVVSGGIEVEVDGTVVVSPQCCCGLEDWREWIDFADGGDSPWAGHDPTPRLERLPSGLLAIGYHGTPELVRHVEPAALRSALAEVERNIAAFRDRLADWAAAIAPELAPTLVARLSHDLAFTPRP